MCFLHSLVFLRTPPSFCLCPQESFGFRELIPQASWLSDPLTSFQETAFLAPNLPAFLSFFGHLEIIVFTFFFLEMVILPKHIEKLSFTFAFCKCICYPLLGSAYPYTVSAFPSLWTPGLIAPDPTEALSSH